MKIVIWHNIMWSSYKAEVFSALAAQAERAGVDLKIFQIATTSGERQALSGVELSRHRYPYELVFEDSYSNIPRSRMIAETLKRTWSNNADLTFLVEISRPEYWAQALLLALLGASGRFAIPHCLIMIRTTGSALPSGPCLPLCKNVFCYGERARAYALHYGVKPENIFQKSGQRAAGRLRCGHHSPAPGHAASAAPLFLYVGRLSPEKRIETLIQAFARFAAIGGRCAVADRRRRTSGRCAQGAGRGRGRG
jgi:glycosyltransferase involved in cell wall biosynthesis